MLIKVDLSEEELSVLEYCVGLSDQDNTSEVDDAIHALIGSSKERQDLILELKRNIKKLQDECQCRVDEVKAQSACEIENLHHEILKAQECIEEQNHTIEILSVQMNTVEQICDCRLINPIRKNSMNRMTSRLMKGGSISNGNI